MSSRISFKANKSPIKKKLSFFEGGHQLEKLEFALAIAQTKGDEKKSINLRKTIDLLNKRFNNNAITWAITKNPQSWTMNKNFLSRSSTTDIEQIPTIVK